MALSDRQELRWGLWSLVGDLGVGAGAVFGHGRPV